MKQKVGLLLAGGAAHGAWQAGVIYSLVVKHGYQFDQVVGYSSGALNGLGCYLGYMEQMISFWQEIDRLKVFSIKPQIKPFSLFGNHQIFDHFNHILKDAENVKGRCNLTVMGVCGITRKRVWGHFNKNKILREYGNLAGHVVGSCAIPTLFPPVPIKEKGKEHLLIDGGAWTHDQLSLKDLTSCDQVIALQMTHPKEHQKKSTNPWHQKQLKIKCENHEMITEGIDYLKKHGKKKQLIYRFYPSRPLPNNMLAFNSKDCQKSLEKGMKDGDTFTQKSNKYKE